MTSLPLDTGIIHFVGIGGIGMSGIAEILLSLGHKVQGSDLKDSPILERLRTMGARIFIGQAADNIGEARVVVVSSAIKPGNPELDAARARALPVVRRADMLAELMRLKWNVAVAGTHGKTTTTSLVAAVLDAGGIDPTVVNGGIIQTYGSNARMGHSRWMVVEADESDGTFTRLPATLAIVTNADPEHLDHYGSVEKMNEAFLQFISNVPFYGAAICCIDHPVVQSLIGKVSDRRVITYGFSPQAEVRAVNLRAENGVHFYDVDLNPRNGTPHRITGLTLPMPGEHNVLNSLAAIAVARQIGVNDEHIKQGLAQFKGVKRRFTRVGEFQGSPIIDDYGHHPVEIAAVLKAARAGTKGRVIAVHQPHRYTRVRDLFNEFCQCFNDADVVIIADIYSAGEAPIEGIHRDALVAGLQAHGHRRALALPNAEALPAMIRAEWQPGDMIVCLGAGNITAWAAGLQAAMERLD